MAILAIDIPREILRIETHVLPLLTDEPTIEDIRALIAETQVALERGNEALQMTLYRTLRAVSGDINWRENLVI